MTRTDIEAAIDRAWPYTYTSLTLVELGRVVHVRVRLDVWEPVARLLQPWADRRIRRELDGLWGDRVRLEVVR